MVRFIDLRGAATGYRFAFFSTNSDTFIALDGDMAWDNVAGLTESHRHSSGTYQLDRFLALIPDWVENSVPTEEEF